MQPPVAGAVLGDFNNVLVVQGAYTARFTRHGDRYFITHGEQGHDPTTLEVMHALGVEPLQQYVVGIGTGRRQVLPWAWDTRDEADGGQHWFHLYADAPPEAGSELHWREPAQNWNHQCAACHVTRYRKRYDMATRRYDSRHAEPGVGCLACHEERPLASDGNGHVYAGPRPAQVMRHWSIDPQTGSARPRPPADTAALETCARCHSRRVAIRDDAGPGSPFMDNYMPTLLEPADYHPDGQTLGEVFEYGAFTQSRMHAAGVTCTDCHEPHGLMLRASGDALCLRCHDAGRFAASRHHGHSPRSPGARCTGCHMPARTYMRIDVRHDHGFKVPRPDLALRHGLPDPCTACHVDRDAAWAAAALVSMGKDVGRRSSAVVEALIAGRRYGRGATRKLVRLAGDEEQAPIVRATALQTLAAYPGASAAAVARRSLADPAPLVRLGALRALAPYVIDDIPDAWALLADPTRAVRIEAARLLAGGRAVQSSSAWPAARRELAQAHALDADRPEAWLDRAALQIAVGQTDDAAASLTEALRIAPDHIAARINLVDVRRRQGREAESVRLLREGLLRHPGSAMLHYADGLRLVRAGRREAAIAVLSRAAELDPRSPAVAIALATALHEGGQSGRALAVARLAAERFPGNVPTLRLAASLALAQGDHALLRRYVTALRAEDP